MSFSSAIQYFLRAIVGITREEIWIETASEINGTYESGGMWQSDKIILDYRNRRIVLDMSAVTKGKAGAIYSRFTMLFRNQSGFWFSIQSDSYASTKKINISDLDAAFYFSGSNIDQIKEFITNSSIPGILCDLKKVDFGIKNKEAFFGHVFPGETVQLQFISEDIAKNKDEIKKVFQLFKATIDRLIQYETMANIETGITGDPY